MVNALSLLRDGRNWELSAVENSRCRGMTAVCVAVCAVLLPFGILGASAAIVIGGTVTSYSTPLDWYFYQELGNQGVRALREKNALQGNQFLKLNARPPEIDPAAFARMRRVAAMSELKGMGLENALALEQLGIKTADDLAPRNPEDLLRNLRHLGRNIRLEEVKIWIRAAKKSRAIHSGNSSQR
jgi:predicted flap endonuclease-1-like 5' DNA nuclease